MGKKLGQHFLKDKNILARIAREALLSSTHYSLPTTRCIIEIGPGHGELTDALLEEGAEKIIAIEKDESLVEHLNRSLVPRAEGRLEVVRGDAREILPKLPTSHYSLLTTPCVITGNIPYYLTGFLFRLLGEIVINHPLLTNKIVLLVQKEVAERVTAVAPRASLLGSMVQGWAEPRMSFTVPRGAFAPPPKVASALLILKPLSHGKLAELSNYFKITKLLFAHPRKTLVNNLREGLPIEKEDAEKLVRMLGLDTRARAAELTPSQIFTLTQIMKPHMSSHSSSHKV